MGNNADQVSVHVYMDSKSPPPTPLEPARVWMGRASHIYVVVFVLIDTEMHRTQHKHS